VRLAVAFSASLRTAARGLEPGCWPGWIAAGRIDRRPGGGQWRRRSPPIRLPVAFTNRATEWPLARWLIGATANSIRPGKIDAVVLDHAANTLRHRLPIDFRPPEELSAIGKQTDRKKRQVERDDLVSRANCDALYARAEEACPECGTPRTRFSKVVVLDGKPVPIEWKSDTKEPDRPKQEDIRRFYCNLVTVVAAKG
jgi:hypothetical protein